MRHKVAFSTQIEKIGERISLLSARTAVSINSYTHNADDECFPSSFLAASVQA